MSSLSLTTFHSFVLHDQIGLVLSEGTRLAVRHEQGRLVSLYHLGFFFVEVHYDPANAPHLWCRDFTGLAGLEPYIEGISLPELT